MPINPYLNFAGNCRQAMEYYAEVFGTEQPRIMTYGQMPEGSSFPFPPEVKSWILHGEIDVAGTTVMFSDVPPSERLTVGNNVILSVVSKDRQQILDWFGELRQGGQIGMDLQETFWSKLYGDLTDQFGTHWLFNLDSGEVFG
jgi:PhnB protein